MSLSSDLHAIFVNKGYLWKVGADRHIPSQDDIALALDRMSRILDNEPSNSSIAVGRLLMLSGDEGKEVYVYLGDYNEER